MTNVYNGKTKRCRIMFEKDKKGWICPEDFGGRDNLGKGWIGNKDYGPKLAWKMETNEPR